MLKAWLFAPSANTCASQAHDHLSQHISDFFQIQNIFSHSIVVLMLPDLPFLFCDHISCKVLSGAEICLLVTGLRTCCNLKTWKKKVKKSAKSAHRKPLIRSFVDNMKMKRREIFSVFYFYNVQHLAAELPYMEMVGRVWIFVSQHKLICAINIALTPQCQRYIKRKR